MPARKRKISKKAAPQKGQSQEKKSKQPNEALGSSTVGNMLKEKLPPEIILLSDDDSKGTETPAAKNSDENEKSREKIDSPSKERSQLALQQEKYNELFDEDYDCTLAVGLDNQEQQIFKFKKEKLVNASSFFKDFLTTNIENLNKPRDEQIRFDKCSPLKFLKMLRLLEGGSLTTLNNMDEVIGLYNLAREWQMTSLEQTLKGCLNDTTPQELVAIYENFKAQNKEKEAIDCFKVLLSTADSIMKTTAWLKALDETVLAMVENDELVVSSELELVDALYYRSQQNNQGNCTDAVIRSKLDKFLPHIRFKNMGVRDFARFCKKYENLLTKEEQLCVLLSLSLEIDELIPKNFCTSSVTRAPYFDPMLVDFNAFCVGETFEKVTGPSLNFSFMMKPAYLIGIKLLAPFDAAYPLRVKAEIRKQGDDRVLGKGIFDSRDDHQKSNMGWILRLQEPILLEQLMSKKYFFTNNSIYTITISHLTEGSKSCHLKLPSLRFENEVSRVVLYGSYIVRDIAGLVLSPLLRKEQAIAASAEEVKV